MQGRDRGFRFNYFILQRQSFRRHYQQPSSAAAAPSIHHWYMHNSEITLTRVLLYSTRNIHLFLHRCSRPFSIVRAYHDCGHDNNEQVIARNLKWKSAGSSSNGPASRTMQVRTVCLVDGWSSAQVYAKDDKSRVVSTYKKHSILQKSPSCRASPAHCWPDTPARCCGVRGSAQSSTSI